MLRTVYTPDSNLINVLIPNQYIGMELEILVSPINEIATSKTKKKHQNADKSFGGWVDMNKTTEEICSEIRNSRAFRNREINLA